MELITNGEPKENAGPVLAPQSQRNRPVTVITSVDGHEIGRKEVIAQENLG